MSLWYTITMTSMNVMCAASGHHLTVMLLFTWNFILTTGNSTHSAFGFVKCCHWLAVTVICLCSPSFMLYSDVSLPLLSNQLMSGCSFTSGSHPATSLLKTQILKLESSWDSYFYSPHGGPMHLIFFLTLCPQAFFSPPLQTHLNAVIGEGKVILFPPTTIRTRW